MNHSVLHSECIQSPHWFFFTRAQFTSNSYFGAEFVNAIGWPENGHLKNSVQILAVFRGM